MKHRPLTPHALLLLATVPFLPATVAAQDDDSVIADDDRVIADVDGWSLDPEVDVSARIGFVDAPVLDDDIALDSDAFSVRVAPSLTAQRGDIAVSLSHSARWLRYFEDRPDRFRHATRLAAGTIGRPVDVAAYVEAGTGFATVEFNDTDQLELGGRVEFEDGAHRFRVDPSWRWRRYDDALESDGDGPAVGLGYRYRLGSNHYIYADAGYEQIDSDTNERRDHDRLRLAGQYQRPIARGLRIRPGIDLRATHFPGRPVIEDGGEGRRDFLVAPDLDLIYSPGPWTVTGTAGYIARSSNDPTFDGDGFRFSLEIGREY